MAKRIKMEDLRTLKMDALADLLNKETTKYYTLIGDRKNGSEIVQCRLMIQKIQKEIDSRKKNISR